MSKFSFKYTFALVGIFTLLSSSGCGVETSETPEERIGKSTEALAPWPCGSGFTCYELPCKVGDTQNGDHCVGDLVVQPTTKK